MNVHFLHVLLFFIFNPITVLVMVVTLLLAWNQKSLTSKKASLGFSGSDSITDDNSKENRRWITGEDFSKLSIGQIIQT